MPTDKRLRIVRARTDERLLREFIRTAKASRFVIMMQIMWPSIEEDIANALEWFSDVDGVSGEPIMREALIAAKDNVDWAMRCTSCNTPFWDRVNLLAFHTGFCAALCGTSGVKVVASTGESWNPLELSLNEWKRSTGVGDDYHCLPMAAYTPVDSSRMLDIILSQKSATLLEPHMALLQDCIKVVSKDRQRDVAGSRLTIDWSKLKLEEMLGVSNV